jgi:hypothetical protein
VRAVSRRAALDQLSATDREIVAVLSEHRVATTQQISTLLELPERTARYRLDRLWRLGMCGGRQPYADQGSAPYHWWPSRLADAFHRGRELPRGGEREEPAEQFLHHAAAITGLYAALVRLAPSLGWELLAFSREVEAREEFTLGDRQAAIVPDAFVVIREGEAEYHAMVEIDRGTMSIPRLSRKLSLYLGWVDSGVWSERHPYVPALLVATTTPRRAEQVVAKAEERAWAESRLAKTHPGAMAIAGMVIAVTDCVDRPEAAVVDPVWRKRGGSGGLRLADLLREPWERWRTETAERAAAAEEAKRELEEFLSSERLRDTLQDLNRNWTGLTSHDEHLWPLAENDATALRLLLNATDPMTPLERRAWGFFARRTEISRYLGRPIEVPEEVSMSSEEREAIRLLREDWFARQKEFVASLHALSVPAVGAPSDPGARRRHAASPRDVAQPPRPDQERPRGAEAAHRTEPRLPQVAGARGVQSPVGSGRHRPAHLKEHAPARPGDRRGAAARVSGLRAARGPLPRRPPVPGWLLPVLRGQGPAAHDVRGRGVRARGAGRRGVLAGTSRSGARMGRSPAGATAG